MAKRSNIIIICKIRTISMRTKTSWKLLNSELCLLTWPTSPPPSTRLVLSISRQNSFQLQNVVFLFSEIFISVILINSFRITTIFPELLSRNPFWWLGKFKAHCLIYWWFGVNHVISIDKLKPKERKKNTTNLFFFSFFNVGCQK